ncbi:hypothetical protein PENCOP_c006G04826 [Penicillium coprophilum]|uniref:Uncharacterized protein n=1 Tax=Penicillium coprophilum TaxID=36646 RepID=A0A1V6UPJ6_9EURO|nr:hypothetical protein PENCOP_c006G04826 [Penicillium coprophilum]
MGSEARVAAFSHLVPDSRLLEVHVKAIKETRRTRRGCHNDDDDTSKLKLLDYRPSLTFDNDATGDEAANGFVKNFLLPFLDEDLQRLDNMVR